MHPVARMRYPIAVEMRECEKTLGLSPLSREKNRPSEEMTEPKRDTDAFVAAGIRLRKPRSRPAVIDQPEVTARQVGPQRQHDESNAG